jgi:hypothetical protein
MTWLVFFRLSQTWIGVIPFRTPLTMTVAPTGEDVTGIFCVSLWVIEAQSETDRKLSARSNDDTKPATFFMFPP